MSSKLLAVVFALVLLGSVLVPSARADEDNQAILFTVNGPVELPGEVLGAGHYELKLQGDGSPIAGVWKADGSQFYGYFLTTPVDRARASRRSKVVLSESVKGAPKKLEKWFYPGDTTGNGFLYPVNQNSEIALGANVCRAVGH